MPSNKDKTIARTAATEQVLALQRKGEKNRRKCNQGEVVYLHYEARTLLERVSGLRRSRGARGRPTRAGWADGRPAAEEEKE